MAESAKTTIKNDALPSDIFAVGDCAEKRDFLTRRLSTTMLASTASAEARVAGMNLHELSPCKVFGGTIAIYNRAVGDSAFGTAGITEEREPDMIALM